MNIDEDILDGLSDRPTVESVRKLIGDDLVDALSIDLGGRHLYIPVIPTENTPIATVIGLEATQKMATVWGGMEFVVPVVSGRLNKIYSMLDAQIPVTRISALLKISSRTIRRIASKKRQEEIEERQFTMEL